MYQAAKQFVEANKNNKFQYTQLPEGADWEKSRFVLENNPAGWMELLIAAPYSDMLQEAVKIKHRFVAHREDHSQGWYSLCIHGIDSNKTDYAGTYGLDPDDQTIYHWTDVSEQCPITTNYFKTVFPYQSYHRVRFMLVEPGGYIAPHTDNQKTNLASAVNISLNNPIGCYLTSELGTVPFRDSGSVFLFNNFYKHAVVNDSDQDRFHIIVHGQRKRQQFDQLALDSYHAALNHS